MDADLIAALERAAGLCDREGNRWADTTHPRRADKARESRADAALIRAHIEAGAHQREAANPVAKP